MTREKSGNVYVVKGFKGKNRDKNNTSSYSNKASPELVSRIVKSVLEAVDESNDGLAESPTREIPNASTQFSESKTEIIERVSSNSAWTILGVLISILAVVVVVNHFNVSSTSDIDFDAYWQSKQPSLMQEVAINAIENDNENAKLAIISSALQRQELPLVRVNFLSTVFHHRWEGKLTEEERRQALIFATKDLLPVSIKRELSLEGVGPIVRFSVAADSSLADQADHLKELDLKDLWELPAPFGTAFGVLRNQQVLSGAGLEARALAHILVGDMALEVIKAYLNSNSRLLSYEELLERLNVLKPLISRSTDIESRVAEAFRFTSPRFFSWFKPDKTIVNWNSVPKITQFQLLLGEVPKQELKTQHYADLLSFINSDVRTWAVASLSKNDKLRSSSALWTVLASPRNQLSRFQIVTLVQTLEAKGAEQLALLSAWFDSKPSQQSVAELLIALGEYQGNENFNVSAARYLMQANWKFSHFEVKKLALHTEPLVRALAYASLDAASQKDRVLLFDLARLEKDEYLSSQIKERLKY